VRKPRALDLFCCAGGVSTGLSRAGFEVVGVDINPQPHHRGGTFVQADALTYPLEGFDFIWASPPCQAYTSLRHLTKGKTYPDLIAPVRERLRASGTPYCIENVPGAPLGVAGGYPLLMLCGTMFGLQTPDGRAEIRRHRHFETSFYIPWRLTCRHGHLREPLTVTGHAPVHGAERRAIRRKVVMCVVGDHPHDAGARKREKRRAMSTPTPSNNTVRTTFSTDDARAAMGIDWMPMKYLSQAIPPAYAEWIGRQALEWEPSLSQFGAGSP